jgi:ABC-type sugar transport system ATPase subunit
VIALLVDRAVVPPGTPAMNVLPGTVVETPDGMVVETFGHRTAVHPRHHRALQGLRRVDLGIRPQALRLGPAGGNGLRGVVFLREPLGLEDEILVEVDGGARLKAISASSVELPEGAPVGLAFAPRDLYVFHPDSKETLSTVSTARRAEPCRRQRDGGTIHR